MEKISNLKFKVGDEVVDKNKFLWRIIGIASDGYVINDSKCSTIPFKEMHDFYCLTDKAELLKALEDKGYVWDAESKTLKEITIMPKPNKPSVEDTLKEGLSKCSKEELIDIITGICQAYVLSVVNRRLSNANYIQQCINVVHTNIQPALNSMVQELKTNLQNIK